MSLTRSTIELEANPVVYLQHCPRERNALFARGPGNPRVLLLARLVFDPHASVYARHWRAAACTFSRIPVLPFIQYHQQF